VARFQSHKKGKKRSASFLCSLHLGVTVKDNISKR
jgi:hypothetical protein